MPLHFSQCRTLRNYSTPGQFVRRSNLKVAVRERGIYAASPFAV
jgi:hypothetical protein